MYARVQIVPLLPAPAEAADANRRLIDVLERRPGFRGVHLFRQIGSRKGLSLSLWSSLGAADAASARTQAELGLRPFALSLDEVCQVWEVGTGSTPVEQAKVGMVSWFDGPVSATQSQALRRFGEERVRPVVEAIPGFARAYVLSRPGDAIVIAELVMSIDTIDCMVDAVSGLGPPPGVDAALLVGPDRVELYRLQDQSVPADVG